MAINLKKLQAIARRKLNLKDAIQWDLVSQSQLSQGLGKDYLSIRSGGEGHVISYSNAESLEPVDVFHELCRAKLNELGFTIIEAAALNAIRDCSKNEPNYIKDASSAVTIVIETFANSILFLSFPEESRIQRERMILRFESSDALTTLHTQMGFWGTAGVCYHRAACNNSGSPFPEDLIRKAIERASDSHDLRKEYDVINHLLEELPKLELGLERISEQDGIRVADVMVRLFSAKTGLEC